MTEEQIEARTRELYRLPTVDFAAVAKEWLAEAFRA